MRKNFNQAKKDLMRKDLIICQKLGGVMKEYERTMKVKSIFPYLKYCRKNGYTEFAPVSQHRIVYENKNCRHIISRITTETVCGVEKTVLDFKNVNREGAALTISNESLPLELTPETKEIVLSMLATMEFEKSADNLRVRYVFKKDDVTFEIDDYSRPLQKLVAIEGDENKVEQIYAELLLMENEKR